MEGVEVLAAADALVGQYLGARADVVVVDVSAELAAEQVHSEHAVPQQARVRRQTDTIRSLDTRGCDVVQRRTCDHGRRRFHSRSGARPRNDSVASRLHPRTPVIK